MHARARKNIRVLVTPGLNSAWLVSRIPTHTGTLFPLHPTPTVSNPGDDRKGDKQNFQECFFFFAFVSHPSGYPDKKLVSCLITFLKMEVA